MELEQVANKMTM